MENNRYKALPHEIYEILDQKKKLIEMKSQIDNILTQVNQTLNSLTVFMLFKTNLICAA